MGPPAAYAGTNERYDVKTTQGFSISTPLPTLTNTAATFTGRPPPGSPEAANRILLEPLGHTRHERTRLTHTRTHADADTLTRKKSNSSFFSLFHCLTYGASARHGEGHDERSPKK